MAFDLEKYKQITGRLDLDGIDVDDFRDRPLAPAHLRCLRYMHDVEMHTSCYLRNLLITKPTTTPRSPRSSPREDSARIALAAPAGQRDVVGVDAKAS